MVEHVRAAMKVAGPGALRALGTGRGAAWLSYEYAGGRSLRSVLARGRKELFPLALDNALEIVRQVCLTLEKVHARTLAGGAPLVHGYLAPWSVVGPVRRRRAGPRGFGLWPGGALGALPESEAGTLAPEQADGQADVRTDVYGLGALLLEALRGAPLPGGVELRALLAETMTPEGDPLPAPLAATLSRALSLRPEERQQGPAELRQELEALLFAGEVAPTTFNLAFFMQTLYRDTVEEDARAIVEETHADYRPYLRGTSAETHAAPALAASEAAPTAPPDSITEPPSIPAEPVAPPVTSPPHDRVGATRAAAGPDRAGPRALSRAGAAGRARVPTPRAACR